MPYNTRRKSLSLPSLGIQLPNGSRGRESATVPPAEQPPQKKVKRIHSSQSPTVHPSRQNAVGEPTPPPSPPPEGSERKINYEGINDEIVFAVIEIIQRTGNRPHTVKELAEQLLPILGIVENSANPHAIISSRLNAYLKRSFTEEDPCLLAKELITTHPRRIYFYLTTCPSRWIPESETLTANINTRRAVVSPELSDEEDFLRRQLSPSPEVDLSSPEFDDDNAPDSSDGPLRSGPTSDIVPRNKSLHHMELIRRNLLSSPPLEGDEQEFTQVGIMLKQRSASREYEERQWRLRQQMSLKRVKEEDNAVLESIPPSDEDLSQHDGKDLEAAATLSLTTNGGDGTRSYRPWIGDVQSPESIELDELDDLLGAEFA